MTRRDLPTLAVAVAGLAIGGTTVAAIAAGWTPDPGAAPSPLLLALAVAWALVQVALTPARRTGRRRASGGGTVPHGAAATYRPGRASVHTEQ